MSNLAVIGAGSWGTALAITLSSRYENVRLWTYEVDLAQRMQTSRENDIYLGGYRLPDNVEAMHDLASTLEAAHIVLGVMPSRFARQIYGDMLLHLTPGMTFVSATKGLDHNTLQRMSEVIDEVVGARFPPDVAVLSGPTFAREVARGEPAAVVIASQQKEVAARIQSEFSGPLFRLYRSQDPIGVEIGAALKNVIAIGAGICHGLGLGNNSLAALITRGLAEITRLAVAMGGRPQTLAGLAGLGDLVLTCTGELSRNRTVGLELAKGRTLSDITGSMRMIAEGVDTTASAVALARQFGVEMPITEQMDSLLRGEQSPRQALRTLMERSLKEESA